VPLAAGVSVVDAVRGLGVPGGVVGVKWPNDVLVGGRGKLAGILAEVEPAARHRDGGPHADGLPAPQNSSAADSGNPAPKQLVGGRAGSLSGRVAVALGIGLNLAIEAFPAGVEGASLHTLLGRSVPWHEALAAVLRALGERLRELESGGIPATAAAWRDHAVGLGQKVTAHTPTGTIRGTALDIADDGALLIDTPQGITRLLAGDVHLERPD
jgi:biotin-(acetyl-CoA carboxylase) ligase